jgi:hypothetical protein
MLRKKIDDALKEYDEKKGILRSIFGDAKSIVQLRKLAKSIFSSDSPDHLDGAQFFELCTMLNNAEKLPDESLSKKESLSERIFNDLRKEVGQFTLDLHKDVCNAKLYLEENKNGDTLFWSRFKNDETFRDSIIHEANCRMFRVALAARSCSPFFVKDYPYIKQYGMTAITLQIFSESQYMDEEKFHQGIMALKEKIDSDTFRVVLANNDKGDEVGEALYHLAEGKLLDDYRERVKSYNAAAINFLFKNNLVSRKNLDTILNAPKSEVNKAAKEIEIALNKRSMTAIYNQELLVRFPEKTEDNKSIHPMHDTQMLDQISQFLLGKEAAKKLSEKQREHKKRTRAKATQPSHLADSEKKRELEERKTAGVPDNNVEKTMTDAAVAASLSHKYEAIKADAAYNSHVAKLGELLDNSLNFLVHNSIAYDMVSNLKAEISHGVPSGHIDEFLQGINQAIDLLRELKDENMQILIDGLDSRMKKMSEYKDNRAVKEMADRKARYEKIAAARQDELQFKINPLPNDVSIPPDTDTVTATARLFTTPATPPSSTKLPHEVLSDQFDEISKKATGHIALLINDIKIGIDEIKKDDIAIQDTTFKKIDTAVKKLEAMSSRAHDTKNLVPILHEFRKTLSKLHPVDDSQKHLRRQSH